MELRSRNRIFVSLMVQHTVCPIFVVKAVSETIRDTKMRFSRTPLNFLRNGKWRKPNNSICFCFQIITKSYYYTVCPIFVVRAISEAIREEMEFYVTSYPVLEENVQ